MMKLLSCCWVLSPSIRHFLNLIFTLLLTQFCPSLTHLAAVHQLSTNSVCLVFDPKLDIVYKVLELLFESSCLSLKTAVMRKLQRATTAKFWFVKTKLFCWVEGKRRVDDLGLWLVTCDLLLPNNKPNRCAEVVFERSTKLCQPAAGQTSGSVKTPDDSSRIPQRPITASLPGCSLPIRKLARTNGRSSWRSQRQEREFGEEKKIEKRKDNLFLD